MQIQIATPLFFTIAGMYLFNCGQVSAKMGESQRRFEEKILTDVITPLKAFLEIDIKSIQVSFICVQVSFT